MSLSPITAIKRLGGLHPRQALTSAIGVGHIDFRRDDPCKRSMRILARAIKRKNIKDPVDS